MKFIPFFFILTFVLTACTDSSVSADAKSPPAPLDAGQLNLDDYQGQYVYVDFWASWCPPCLASFPWMNALHKDFSEKGLKIVAVNTDFQQKAAKDFLAKTPADFEVIYDPASMIAEQFEVKAMPSSFLFDPEGELIDSYQGFNNKKATSIRNQIKALLNK